ncbi:hypothetical protein G647_07175 [Cladophialophora carrionii CBS 160.54]|uniref:Transcription factor domain-containing protein n=1 Tax=Cladophialophora carrionii CBS 160.54 TaxID=1279043 RepID=V9D3G0_9EURO|nr:uncharacterized protein G647_07175 [Cladophialophora carrionii CBS 160.54]ETI20833.1 hypothetical protein G647_07175 [Cladophialophora carrionii CBS 160.54]
MADYNATHPADPVDERQRVTDDQQVRDPDPTSQEDDELNAASRPEHRRRRTHGRDARQHNIVPARTGPGLAASGRAAHGSTNRALQHVVRQPGGRFDSFNTLPSGADGADFVAKLVLYAHHQVYSNFFVGEVKDTSVLPYTKYALHHEHAYWGAAWFSCTSRRWLAGQSMQHTPQELFFYTKSLESLRQALSDPTLATHESTISTILHLSFPPYLPHVDRSMPRPRQSNFKTWNLLHLATGLNVAEEHMLGLAAVVKVLGGVQNIQSAQIRRSVCFQGIHFSGRHLKAPLFPFASLHPVDQLVHASRLRRSRHAFDPVSAETSRRRGTGFDDISFPEVLPLDTTPQPAVVWAYLADMTTILEDYASGGSMQSQTSVILDQMQFTQHSLLSLPPAADLQRQGRQEEHEHEHEHDQRGGMATRLQLYEITRWACICYANLITYPTDYSTFPRLRLARLLLRELNMLYETSMIAQLTRPEQRLVFWATVLGAIKAVGYDDERASFVALVARSAGDAKVRSWTEARAVMESFLWHGQTSDPDALKLWVEVQRVARPHAAELRLPERMAGAER